MSVVYAKARDDEPQELKGQIARCQDRAKSRGTHVEADEIYTDGGDSDSSVNRIGLRTLIEGVKDGRIHTVYVDTLDCLGRPLPAMNMRARWLKKGVQVIVATQDEVLPATARAPSLGAR